MTKLRTAQGELIIVPNSAMRQVTNLSRDWSKAVVDIPVSVAEDLEHVTSILKEEVSDDDGGRPLAQPPPRRTDRGRR